jgi:hypothetical protein
MWIETNRAYLVSMTWPLEKKGTNRDIESGETNLLDKEKFVVQG